MQTMKELYPERVFYYFSQLAAIPHGSRNTKAISDYLVRFAREHELFFRQDAMGNVVMAKEATAGYEQAPAVILQGHMDMVCEKEADCALDMEREGLELYVDGDYLKARGTTLGGDDGIAVAYMLALFESTEIPHPRLEAIVTADEEIGMLGAAGLDLSDLTGRVMLNIDSDVEGVFLTGCAGGAAVNASIPVTREKREGERMRLSVTGCLGGHSGSEIDKERANADLVMGRVLSLLSERFTVGLLALSGGQKDNAIPRESTAELLVPPEQAEGVLAFVTEQEAVLRKETYATDPDITVCAKRVGASSADVLTERSFDAVNTYLSCVPNGIMHRSQQQDGLVETSLNLGILELTRDALTTVTSVRSSVGSRKEELCARMARLVGQLGGVVSIEGDYPAWEYRADSALRPQIAAVYERLFHKKPIFTTIHAGLECGLLSEKLPGLDCVSFGPENLDIHTPNERLSIPSVGRMWDFLVAFLEQAR